MVQLSDWVVLGVIALQCTLAIFINLILFRESVQTFLPVKFQNTRVIRLLLLGGCIHSISAFLSNEHFSVVESAESKWLCLGNAVFLQYGIGLNLYIFCLMRLMISFGKFFDRNLFMIYYSHKPTHANHVKLKQLIPSDEENADFGEVDPTKNIDASVFINLVPVILFIPVVIYSTVYIENEEICSVENVVRYFIMGWVTFVFLLIVILNQRLKNIKNQDTFKQFQPIDTILNESVTVLFINVFVHFNGMWEYASFRFFATVTIACYYIFVTYHVIGKHIYYALRNDSEYSTEFVLNHEWNHRIPVSYPSRATDISNFLEYCGKNATIHKNNPRNKFTVYMIEFLNGIQECSVEEAKVCISLPPKKGHAPEHVKPKFNWESICNIYLNYASGKNLAVALSNHMFNLDSFDEYGPALVDPVNFFKTMDRSVLKHIVLAYLDTIYGAGFDTLMAKEKNDRNIVKKSHSFSYQFSNGNNRKQMEAIRKIAFEQ